MWRSGKSWGYAKGWEVLGVREVGECWGYVVEWEELGVREGVG